jgi:lambda family phage tail tape measure protein
VASYGAVIEVSVKGQQALDRLEGSARKIEGLIQGIKQQKNIFDQAIGSDKTRQLKRNLENIVATFAGAKEGARQFKVSIGGTEQTINMYSKTLAGLNSQLGTFRAIANNATVGTDQYRNAVVAANKVSNEFARTQAKAFKVSTSVSGMNVKDVLALGKSIPDTIEGLTFYQAALEDVLRTVKIGSGDFRALEEAITSTGARLSSARLTGQKTAITPAAGPASRIDTVASYQKRASYAQKVADLEYKQLVTGQQIVQAKLKQNQQEDLQNRLAQASEALQNNELNLAKRLTAELRNQRIAYERVNRLMRPTSMVAGAAESVTGRRPGGLPPVPGSRAAWLATGGVQAPPAAAKTVTDALDQSIGLQKRYNNLLTSAQIIEQKSLTYKAKGLETDQQIATVQNLIQNIRENGATATKQYLDALDNILNSLRNELKLTKAVADARKATAKPAAPTGAGGAAAKKPAARGAGFQNALIGGAFPLLFGGGPGAVIGGFAGGFIPGNPMMSIVTSAVGTLFDAFMAKTFELGNALNSTATIFDSLKEKSLVSNREREKEIQLLQDAGFAATANAVAQEELFKTIGANGVESLRELGTESDRLNRTWAELSVQIQAVVAGPLADLAAKLNEFFKPIAQAGRAEALRADLSAADRARFNQELNRAAAKGTYRPTGEMNRPQLEALATVRPEQLQALLDKYGRLRVNADVKFDPRQVREETVNILQKQLEVIDIAQKFREAGEKQKELDRQRYDLVASYEESIAAIRRRIEDEITSKRLTLIQKENELLDVQAQIRQESLALANAQALSTAGQGLPTAAQFGGNDPFRTRAFKDVARQAAEAAGSFLEQELSLAEQAAKLKRDAALDALRTDLEAAKFQADTAREVNKLNVDTAKRVAEINASIRKQNASQDNRRFEIEQKLAIIRLQTLQAEFSLLATKAPTDNLREEAQILTQFSIAATKYVEAQKAPAPLKELGGIGAQGVSLAGLDAINAQLKLTQDRINAAQLALNDLLVLKNEQEFVAKMQRIAESIDAPLQTLTEELVANEATRTRYAELIREGVRGVVAERLIEVEQLKEAAVLQYDAVILELEKKLQIDSTNEKLKEQIRLYKERRDAVAGKAVTAVDAIKEEESPATRLQAAITKAREELNELADPINAAVTGANAIGSAFSQAFQGIATGTMTAQEALSNFFKSIGEAFVSMAAEIIAKQLVMITLQTILKALGAVAGGGGGESSPAPNIQSGGDFNLPGQISIGMSTAAKGAYWPGGFQAFADGGLVTKPTMGLIGEGGEPEYVIPASKMRAAMGRYAGGARGASVIPGNGESGTGGYGGGSGGTIDVRYSIERINNVDYVTADQFQRGMAQAAQQGAVQGERRAMRSLKNSASTRRSIGI